MKTIHPRLGALALAAALLCAPLARAANDTFSVNGLPFLTSVPGGYLPAFAAYFPNGLGTTTPLSVAGVYAASGVASVESTFSATGNSAAFTPIYGRNFNISIIGTFVGTIQLQRYIDATIGWVPITAAGTPLLTWTGPASEMWSESQVGVLYRLSMTAYTSGTATYSISQ
jgi:hypothetical protein